MLKACCSAWCLEWRGWWGESSLHEQGAYRPTWPKHHSHAIRFTTAHHHTSNRDSSEGDSWRAHRSNEWSLRRTDIGMATMHLAPFQGNMLARGLEGSSMSRDGAECPGRALVAWGEGHPCAFRWKKSGGRHGWAAMLATGTFFRGNMLARGLKGSSTSRDETECPGKALVAWGEGHPCAFWWATSGGRHGWAPRGEPRRWPLAHFSEAACSLEGLSRDGEGRGRVLRFQSSDSFNSLVADHWTVFQLLWSASPIIHSPIFQDKKRWIRRTLSR